MTNEQDATAPRLRRKRSPQLTLPELGERSPTVPTYVAIEELLIKMIHGPELSPGGRIPSERELSSHLGASRMTVRKAIDGLVARGLLTRNGTSGTRVAKPKVIRPVDMHSAIGIRRVIQSGGGAASNKLLHFEQGKASASVAGKLQILEGAELLVIRRLWSVNDVPFCIETSYIPAQYVSGLAAEDLVAGQSLYDILSARFGLRLIPEGRTISVGICSQMEASLLGLPLGSPALLLRLLSTDPDGRPVEFMSSVNNPSMVAFKTYRPG